VESAGNSYVLRSLVFLFVRLTPDLDWAVGLDLRKGQPQRYTRRSLGAQ
jgi:hypothetical protein